MLETLVWVLPRPRHYNMYKGGFPLHFETKLINLYEEKYGIINVLQPFGGKAEYGIINDIKIEVAPDIVSDAHNLPFPCNYFDFVLFDPPYSKEEAKKLYNTDYIKLTKCIQESVRVLKSGGFIALYHRLWLPRPKNTKYDLRILVHPGQWHEARTCHVFKKTTEVLL